MRDTHDVAQICMNGHVVNRSFISLPHHNQSFCSICSASTITTCQECDNPIRGYHAFAPKDELHLYCHECGKPYPWTEALIRAAQELADIADNLNDQERDNLKEDINDLISNTPRAPAAAHRAERLATKAGIKDALISIFSNIASDTLVKLTRGW